MAANGSVFTEHSDTIMIASSSPQPDPASQDTVWPMVAGIFAFLALFMSIWEITQHLNNYNKPYLQKYVVRILWMVPIYAMNSVSFDFFRFFCH